MKYITIVFLFMAASLSEAATISSDKLTSEESASAEADLDALLDKYDDKES